MITMPGKSVKDHFAWAIYQIRDMWTEVQLYFLGELVNCYHKLISSHDQNLNW